MKLLERIVYHSQNIALLFVYFSGHRSRLHSGHAGRGSACSENSCQQESQLRPWVYFLSVKSWKSLSNLHNGAGLYYGLDYFKLNWHVDCVSIFLQTGCNDSARVCAWIVESFIWLYVIKFQLCEGYDWLNEEFLILNI